LNAEKLKNAKRGGQTRHRRQNDAGAADYRAKMRKRAKDYTLGEYIFRPVHFMIRWTGFLVSDKFGRKAVSMKIIKAVPVDDYNITVCFDNNDSVTLDIKDKLKTVRFSGLRSERVFREAQTDGKSLHWPGGISMAVSEILELGEK